MPSGHQTDEHAVYYFALTYDDLSYFIANLIEPGNGELKICVCGHKSILKHLEKNLLGRTTDGDSLAHGIGQMADNRGHLQQCATCALTGKTAREPIPDTQ